MPQIELTDEVFQVASRRAADGGYASVDAYIADVVVQDHDDDLDNLDFFFTPERIAELKKISDEIKAGGKTYSMEEVEQHFEEKKRAWLATHGS